MIFGNSKSIDHRIRIAIIKYFSVNGMISSRVCEIIVFTAVIITLKCDHKIIAPGEVMVPENRFLKVIALERVRIIAFGLAVVLLLVAFLKNVIINITV